jgi:hypothetical protein
LSPISIGSRFAVRGSRLALRFGHRFPARRRAPVIELLVAGAIPGCGAQVSNFGNTPVAPSFWAPVLWRASVTSGEKVGRVVVSAREVFMMGSVGT